MATEKKQTHTVLAVHGSVRAENKTTTKQNNKRGKHTHYHLSNQSTTHDHSTTFKYFVKTLKLLSILNTQKIKYTLIFA